MSEDGSRQTATHGTCKQCGDPWPVVYLDEQNVCQRCRHFDELTTKVATLSRSNAELAEKLAAQAKELEELRSGDKLRRALASLRSYDPPLADYLEKAP